MNNTDVPVVKCICGAPMVIRTSKYGKFWGCSRYPVCKEKHGAHQNSGKPLGKPADADTRAARIEVHALFDRLWKEEHMNRHQAYRWLAKQFNAPEVHIGEFSLQDCGFIMPILKKELANIEEEDYEPDNDPDYWDVED